MYLKASQVRIDVLHIFRTQLRHVSIPFIDVLNWKERVGKGLAQLLFLHAHISSCRGQRWGRLGYLALHWGTFDWYNSWLAGSRHRYHRLDLLKAKEERGVTCFSNEHVVSW